MRCHCYETETEFVLCVEDVPPADEDNLRHAWFQPSDRGYVKAYPRDMEGAGVTEADKQAVSRNFARLGPAMFEGVSDWSEALASIAERFRDNGVEWYIIGSASEAVLGVNVRPHDLDIIVRPEDFFRVRDLFADCVVEPFVDNQGTWLVRYFGRLCVGGAMVDIAADEKMNPDRHPYDRVSWHGFDVLIEPLQARYRVEIERGREDRVRAIEAYMNGSPVVSWNGSDE